MPLTIIDTGGDRHRERQLVLADAFEQTLGHLGTDDLMAAADVLRAPSRPSTTDSEW